MSEILKITGALLLTLTWIVIWYLGGIYMLYYLTYLKILDAPMFLPIYNCLWVCALPLGSYALGRLYRRFLNAILR